MKAYGKGSRRAAIVLLLVQLMFLYWLIDNSEAAFILRLDKEDQKVVRAAKSGLRNKIIFDLFERDEEQKECIYAFIIKEYVECDMKDFFQVRKQLNRYLKENPDCYLNQGYKIWIWLSYEHSGPIMGFQNYYQYYEKNELWDQLDCVSIDIPVDESDLIELSDCRAIELRGPWMIEESTLLNGFERLKYLHFEFISERKQEEIRKVRPDIKVSYELRPKAI